MLTDMQDLVDTEKKDKTANRHKLSGTSNFYGQNEKAMAIKESAEESHTGPFGKRIELRNDV